MKIRWLLPLIVVGFVAVQDVTAAIPSPPNILFAISDDQSWPHASAYGSKMVATPTFDRIAREGVLFNQAFCASPGCSPCRAALLTGRHTWQIEHAGTHASSFAARYETFPDRLEASGYFVGYVGKGWGPGNWKAGGRTRNPAGPMFSGGKSKQKLSNYVAGFKAFLEARPNGKPFCFWFGSHDPHRGYAAGSGRQAGKRLEDADLPPFLPDTPVVRGDLLDYAAEIDRFDGHLGQMIETLENAGQLDNTLVIVTSDNGMPFPRAKANCYEYGIHMPLAIRWAARVPKGRVVDDLIGFVDLTATIYDMAGVEPATESPIAGRSIANILFSEKQGIVDPARDAVYAARERHSSSRYRTLGYPQRCIRTRDYLYIRNLKSERWPAGAPQKYGKGGYARPNEVVQRILGPEHGGYHDIDGSPTLSYMVSHRGEPKIDHYLQLAVARRPAEELFDVRKDPGCLHNLAADAAFADTKQRLRDRLDGYLKQTGDTRMGEEGDVWETYPRYSPLRWFPTPEWARQQPARVPKPPWLEQRRPR